MWHNMNPSFTVIDTAETIIIGCDQWAALNIRLITLSNKQMIISLTAPSAW